MLACLGFLAGMMGCYRRVAGVSYYLGVVVQCDFQL